MSQLELSEVIRLLQIFAQAQAQTGFFYKRLEKYIGVHSDEVRTKDVYLILKSFSLVSSFISDYDVQKIYVKLQRLVI